MKNFEFWEKEIREICDNGNSCGLVKGKPVSCDDIMCSQCDLGDVNCDGQFVSWLYKEHVEKPKIDKRTKMFFDAIETGWVARDKGGVLCLYTTIPRKGNSHWYSSYYSINNQLLCLNGILGFITLDFVKWEDDKPWKVEDIRNLEVI